MELNRELKVPPQVRGPLRAEVDAKVDPGDAELVGDDPHDPDREAVRDLTEPLYAIQWGEGEVGGYFRGALSGVIGPS